jgi:hypothetical protein
MSRVSNSRGVRSVSRLRPCVSELRMPESGLSRVVAQQVFELISLPVGLCVLSQFSALLRPRTSAFPAKTGQKRVRPWGAPWAAPIPALCAVLLLSGLLLQKSRHAGCPWPPAFPDEHVARPVVAAALYSHTL